MQPATIQTGLGKAFSGRCIQALLSALIIAASGWADENLPGSLQHFLGNPLFFSQEMWSGETGGRSIITALNGDVLLIKGDASSEYRRSTNGGQTWTTANAAGAARFSNALINESNGRIFVFNGSSNVRSYATSNGNNWTSDVSHLPALDSLGRRPTTYSSMQAGITLRYGPKAGRLLSPARVQIDSDNSNTVRAYAYSSAIFSDDGGATWKTSQPFPIFGTGEAAVVELKDGRILYNSREHMSIGNRFIATSFDGGETWVSPYRDPTLPDGPRGTSYGCMGGLIRLPVDEYDILIYSNLDTDRGELPSQIGGTRTQERENITLWASFDGGLTWPIKRLVFGGPSAYSNLGVGRAGTASQGRIFLAYDGGPNGRNTAAQMVVFNLSWLLQGANIHDFLASPIISSIPTIASGQHVYLPQFSGEGEKVDPSKSVARETEEPQQLDLQHVINCTQGITGLIVDLEHSIQSSGLTSDDLSFQVSPIGVFDQAVHPPAEWAVGPQPYSIAATTENPNRLYIQWPERSIMNRWLRVTIKANEATGLVEPQVFYIGHLLGNLRQASDGAFSVSFRDITKIRARIGQSALVQDPSDIDKNGSIGFADIVAMRANIGGQLTQITIPSASLR